RFLGTIDISPRWGQWIAKPGMTTIQEFFTGRTVLVTGATGFLGKAIVEKALRGLPDVHRIYLLIRPKERGSRAVPADQRFRDEVLKSSIFDRLRRELGDKFDDMIAAKIAVIAGDLTDEQFGASGADYQRLTDEVQVILNSAAVVSFDERLDLSLNLNTQGARRMMDFARLCPRLEALIHISTCYVSGTAEGRIDELVPPPAFDVENEVADLERACAEITARHGSDPNMVKE